MRDDAHTTDAVRWRDTTRTRARRGGEARTHVRARLETRRRGGCAATARSRSSSATATAARAAAVAEAPPPSVSTDAGASPARFFEKRAAHAANFGGHTFLPPLPDTFVRLAHWSSPFGRRL